MTPGGASPASRAPASAGRRLGLYLHWPFARSVPTHPEFDALVRPDIDESRYAAALTASLERLSSPLGPVGLDSVLIGGGVPSMIGAQTLAGLLGTIEARFGADPSREVTLEADPEPDMVARYAGYRATGVNRLTVRVRSLGDAGLRALGCGWTPGEVRDAVVEALRHFRSVAIDLTFGWADQSVAAWLAELDDAAALGVAHVTLHELAPADRGVEASPALACDAVREAMYLDGAARLEALGLPAYEIANFARPGREGRHNDHVWRGGELLAVGPGAVSRLGLGSARSAREGIADLDAWLAAVESGDDGSAGSGRLDAITRRDELVEGALRRRAGLARADCRAVLGSDLEAVLPAEPLAELVADGFLALDRKGLRATPRGWPVLDAVLHRLLLG